MRYVGDAVALVVADTEDLAMEAMDKIKVEYEQLEPVYTIDEAMKPGAPQLYKEFPGNIAPYKQNLHFEAGDSGKGFEEADVIVEMDSELTSGQNPLPAGARLPPLPGGIRASLPLLPPPRLLPTATRTSRLL